MASASVVSVNIGGLGAKAFVQGAIAPVAPVVPPPMVETRPALMTFTVTTPPCLSARTSMSLTKLTATRRTIFNS